MARKSKAQTLLDIHAEALAEFDEIQSALHDERKQCLEDRRFYSISGAQWEGSLGEQFENKPKFEVNKVHLAVIRIINEYRNNRITVDFISKEGDEYDDLADTCDGLYRADEQDSVAEEAYDNAFEEAVGGGFGAFRLRTCYEDEEDEENEKQRIRIEPIFDADSSVFFDLNAKRQDKSDAKRCFVITSMTRSAYRIEYNDDPSSWPKDIQQYEFDWLTPDVVYIAEYYRVEDEGVTKYVYQALDGEETTYTDDDFENDEMLEETLLAIGSKLVRQRRVKRQRVHKYILSGSKILEDCGFIAGSNIPIIPVYGKRWFVDNVERCMGHVRLAKDPQRLKNMQLSKLGEISALSATEKPILTPEQIAGHGQMWSEDNVKNYPYLLVNPITDANGQQMASGPIAYTKPPSIPPAMAALLQLTEQDMQDILGNQQQADKIVSNISGDAVEMIQNRLDMQTFIYMSNMAKAIRRAGEVWLGMAKDVYVEKDRKMKTVGLQGNVSTVEIGKPTIGKDGKIEKENDLSEAKFDVTVDVGPSSSSKRASTVRSLTNLLLVTKDPETAAVISAMIMMNTEGEGISEVRDFFRNKLIRMGVVKPTEEEAQMLAMEMQNAKPTPNDEYLRAAAEQAKAEAIKAQANAMLAAAKADESQAKTIETLANVDNDARKSAVETAKTITEMLKQPAEPTQ